MSVVRGSETDASGDDKENRDKMRQLPDWVIVVMQICEEARLEAEGARSHEIHKPHESHSDEE